MDLGKQPICNAFLKAQSDFKEEKFYPFELSFCPSCTLVQLSQTPPASVVYGKDYNYLSGTTPEIVKYFDELGARLVKKLHLKQGDMVLDIGSNDGTFLQAFSKRGLDVLGVDPAPEACKAAESKGIDTICGPFEDSIPGVKKRIGKELKLITAANVLAHTDRPHQFLEGIFDLCAENATTFVSQSQYLPEDIEKVEWDTFYHEHARYYTLTSLEELLYPHGIHVYDAERVDFYGGSFLVYASIGVPQRTSRKMDAIESSEKRYLKLETYKQFAHEVQAHRDDLNILIMEIKAAGKHIAGIGAPMKASTILNYCGIGIGQVDYLTELNPLKIGTYLPGMHIPVVEEERLFTNQPDYALILSWNVADRIMMNLRNKGYKGDFILPFPKPRILR